MIKMLFYTLFLIALLSCQNKQEEKADSDLQNIEQSNLNKEPKEEVKIIDLEGVDYKAYCGKTLGELLEDETLKNYEDYYFVDEPPFVLAFIVFKYPSTDKTLSIHLGSLVHQKSLNVGNEWSFDLLKKEKFKVVFVSENDWSSKKLLNCICKGKN
jgi:hypothetical protein